MSTQFIESHFLNCHIYSWISILYTIYTLNLKGGQADNMIPDIWFQDTRIMDAIFRITFSKLSYLQLYIHRSSIPSILSIQRERGQADNMIPDIRFQDTRIMDAIYRITFSKLSYLQLDIHPIYHLYSQSREREGRRTI